MCNAYTELATDRAVGSFGIGPIPGRVVRDWCREMQLDSDAARRVRYVIRLVDNETLRRAARSK